MDLGRDEAAGALDENFFTPIEGDIDVQHAGEHATSPFCGGFWPDFYRRYVFGRRGGHNLQFMVIGHLSSVIGHLSLAEDQ